MSFRYWVPLVSFLLLSLFSSFTWASVIYDASSRGMAVSGASSLTYALTVGTDSNRAMAVFVVVGNQCGDLYPTVSGVTYAGVALSQVASKDSTFTMCGGATSKPTRLSIWSLPAGTQPKSGTNNVVVTLSGALAATQVIHSAAVSAAGVDQTTTFTSNNVADAEATTPVTVTLGSSGLNDLVASFAYNGGSITGASSPQTLRQLLNINNVFTSNNSGLATAPGGTTSLSWDVDNTETDGMAAVSFKAATIANSVSLDAVGPDSNGAGGTGLTSITWSHTTSGTNRLLVATLAVDDAASLGDSTYTTSMTYNGVAMTSAAKVHTNNFTGGFVELFYLIAPDTGTHNVVATITGGTVNAEAGSVSFTGVDQTTPLRNLSTAAGNGQSNPSLTVSSAIGNMAITAIANGSSITSAGSDQNLLWKKNVTDDNGASNSAFSSAPGASAVPMSYAVTNDRWAMIGYDVVASGNSTASTPRVRHRSANETTASSTSITVPIAPTAAGDLLVVGAASTGTRTVSSVSDGTNAFTKATGAAGAGSTRGTDVWYLLKSTAGKTSITITFSGSAGTFTKEGYFWEVTGFTSPVFDAANKVTAAAPSNGITSGASVTSTAATGKNVFAVGVILTNGGIQANPYPGSSFKWGGDISTTNDAACSAFGSGSGTYQPLWADSGTAATASTATFKESTKVLHRVIQE
jgi:hypothetical protein